uniref:Homeodomain-leucine zipper protein n=1 Tax=Oryza sativa subsp. japonica TaxID=39947 RepID=Q94GC2_ORYSJ|nr:Putative homeodomain-leucine zipper protein [Oryza sativa]
MATVHIVTVKWKVKGFQEYMVMENKEKVFSIASLSFVVSIFLGMSRCVVDFPLLFLYDYYTISDLAQNYRNFLCSVCLVVEILAIHDSLFLYALNAKCFKIISLTLCLVVSGTINRVLDVYAEHAAKGETLVVVVAGEEDGGSGSDGGGYDKAGMDSGKYVQYTPDQVEALERVYAECPKPSFCRRQQSPTSSPSRRSRSGSQNRSLQMFDKKRMKE